MAIEITVPRLGWSMDQGTFSQWLKREGETVEEGDALFELESDKAVQAVESFDSGILRIGPDGPKPGDVVKVGQCLGYLCRAGESFPIKAASQIEELGSIQIEERLGPPRAVTPAPIRPLPAINARHAANGQPEGPPPRPVASPSVRRLARQLGVDVKTLQSEDGAERITAKDVRALAKPVSQYAEASRAANSQFRVSPRAARAAARLGVNLADVSSSGLSGRICERDVLAAASSSPPAPPANQAAANETSEETALKFVSDEGEPAISSLRRTIASRMLAAAQETAAVTLTSVAEATELVNIRRQFKATTTDLARPVPSFTDMFVMLAATALEQHPAMLQQWSNERITLPEGVHVAVAVDTQFGLLTPVLRDVSVLNLAEVADRLASLIARARDRRLSPAELQGGTFTVSNLGGYRIDAFTPLLNLPQTAILGVGRISTRPTVVEGRVEVRDCVSLSLTFDHRVVDGAAAAALLTKICKLVESPLPTLLR